MEEVKFFDRKTKELKTELQYKGKALNVLYKNPFGRLVLKSVLVRPWFSKVVGKYQGTKLSVNEIPKFIKNCNINMDDYEQADYKSFNDFFTRKLKVGARVIDKNPNALISVADSKLMAYEISSDSKIKIKLSEYTIKELVQDSDIANEFNGGTCLVFRLAVDNYHRYAFFDDGKLLQNKKIKGCLHTVRSVSQDRYKIYSENSREVSILDTQHFGKAVYVEVGAMLVGKIVNHNKNSFAKAEEKGYFEYGGSTIVLLFKKNAICVDEDIVLNSKTGYETAVQFGEKIGLSL